MNDWPRLVNIIKRGQDRPAKTITVFFQAAAAAAVSTAAAAVTTTATAVTTTATETSTRIICQMSDVRCHASAMMIQMLRCMTSDILTNLCLHHLPKLTKWRLKWWSQSNSTIHGTCNSNKKVVAKRKVRKNNKTSVKRDSSKKHKETIGTCFTVFFLVADPLFYVFRQKWINSKVLKLYSWSSSKNELSSLTSILFWQAVWMSKGNVPSEGMLFAAGSLQFINQINQAMS